jgi:hypothetical protein
MFSTEYLELAADVRGNFVLPPSDANGFCRILRGGIVTTDNRFRTSIAALGMTGEDRPFLVVGYLAHQGFSGRVTFRDPRPGESRPRSISVNIPAVDPVGFKEKVEEMLTEFERAHFTAQPGDRRTVIENYGSQFRGADRVYDAIMGEGPVVLLSAGNDKYGMDSVTEMIGAKPARLQTFFRTINDLSAFIIPIPMSLRTDLPPPVDQRSK